MLLHVNIFGALILLVPALIVWRPLEGVEFGVVALGPIAIAAQYGWIMAYRATDAVIVTPIGYAWVIFAAALGYVVFDEAPTVPTLLGSALICTGGVVLARTPPARRATPPAAGTVTRL